MEQSQKTKNLIKNIILIVLFVGALVWYTGYYEKQNLTNQNEENALQLQNISNCGLSINYTKEVVGDSFKVEAILDNNERETLGCSWTAFEAQAGVVYIKDGNGNDVINPTPLTTVMEWMTDDPVLYTANVQILNNYKGDALVIVNEDDPSGEKISKTITFPITIK